MSRQLDPTDEDLLQAALTSSFTKLPPKPTSAFSPTPSAAASLPPAPPADPTPAEAAAITADDPEKEEYERRLAAWRAESAVARDKAERTRAEWEVRRKAEEEEERRAAAERKARKASESTLAGWENVSPTEPTTERVPLGQNPNEPVPGTSVGGGVGTSDEAASAGRVAAAESAVQQHEAEFGVPPLSPGPSPADVRDLVSGETSRSRATSGLSFPSSSAANPIDHLTPSGLDSEEEGEPRISRQWEEVPSLASSFPSLPENISSSSSQDQVIVTPPQTAPEPSIREKSAPAPTAEPSKNAAPSQPARPTPPSMALSVFNASLPTRTRAIALVSALTINMFLPFVNGVMLGFGEIFARNVVAPLFGWKAPLTVASLGLRGAEQKRR